MIWSFAGQAKRLQNNPFNLQRRYALIVGYFVIPPALSC